MVEKSEGGGWSKTQNCSDAQNFLGMSQNRYFLTDKLFQTFFYHNWGLWYDIEPNLPQKVRPQKIIFLTRRILRKFRLNFHKSKTIWGGGWSKTQFFRTPKLSQECLRIVIFFTEKLFQTFFYTNWHLSCDTGPILTQKVRPQKIIFLARRI